MNTDSVSHEKTAIVLGGTGLTGSACLSELEKTKAYAHVIEAGRKPSGQEGKKSEFVEINFEDSSSLEKHIKGNVIFCCLGTTHSKAGSNEAFRKVDFDYVFASAQAGKKNGVQHFFLVSSMGANPESKINYSKVKGEIEDAVSKLGFESVHIFRPSVLLGDRKEKRSGEKLMQAFMSMISFVFTGPLKNYKGISGTTVAQAMIMQSLNPGKGVFIHPSAEIQTMAKTINR